jgi:hypothetical protein
VPHWSSRSFGSWVSHQADSPFTGTTVSGIHIIKPYWHSYTWVFDDGEVGLSKEPVCGIPEMIDTLVATVPQAKTGFRLLFSSEPFPGYQLELVRINKDDGGTWYRWAGRAAKGWLCPALLKYYPEAPGTLYVRAESLHR